MLMLFIQHANKNSSLYSCYHCRGTAKKHLTGQCPVRDRIYQVSIQQLAIMAISMLDGYLLIVTRVSLWQFLSGVRRLHFAKFLSDTTVESLQWWVTQQIYSIAIMKILTVEMWELFGRCNQSD